MRNTSVALLGSTGSIGIQTVTAIRSLGMRIALLSARSNVAAVEAQIREFSPRIAVMTDESAAAELAVKVADTSTRIYSGTAALNECVGECDAETVVNAVVGFAGLAPSLAALHSGKRLALANKESLVAGGKLVTDTAKETGMEIFPIDSEHSAVFQSMLASRDRKAELEKIILTGSGGPFRGKSKDYLASVTPQEAVRHPNWNMGAKISVDSATLMNKGLEVIEAVRLFEVPAEMIEVVIHRESIVHSMVRFRDKSVIAQMSYPDMALPIRYALTYPQRCEADFEPLDLARVGSLTFERPDTDTFPCLMYAYKALEMGGNAAAALNGANEEAVALFLAGSIAFTDIPICAEAALEELKPTEYSVDGIIAADAQGRRSARKVMKG